MLLKIRQVVLWVALASSSVVLCVTAGGLLGFLFGLVVAGAADDAGLLGMIGAIGGLAGSPIVMAFFRERCGQSPSATLDSPDDLQERQRDELPDKQPQTWVSVLVRIGWILLLPVLPITAYEWIVWSLLRSDGEVIQANVTSLAVSSHWRTTHEVTYEFQLPDGQAFSGTQEIGQELHQRLRLGDCLPVLYLPSNPSTSRLAEDEGKVYEEMVERMTSLKLDFCTFAPLRRRREAVQQCAP